MIYVNLKGEFFCLKHEIIQMKKQGKGGSIVDSSSSSYFQPSPGFAAYVASKTGVVGLTKVAALENANIGIRVNAICPGPTRTQLLKTLAEHKPEEIDIVKAKIPMHRLGEPIDIARTVVWLCSDDASFITGQVIPVDGGLTTGG
jgi:NAD(P)-dependent dehydrogenase (short-subunit alcohol dehydrogenase family)